jgi:RNA polymerase-binding transcription factor DksA
MSKVSEMVNAEEHRYVLRDEAARAPVASTKQRVRRQPRKDMQMHSLESDIHPHCECCGERIEAGRSTGDACARRCNRCAAAAEDKSSA